MSTLATRRAEERPQTLYWYGGALFVLLIVVATKWWLARPVYPPVSSGTSLLLIKQLYTACNTKNVKLLDKFDERLQREYASQKITDQELAHFRDIASVARAGDWETSMKQAYRFAQDQRTD
jgi:hypothetical protein